MVAFSPDYSAISILLDCPGDSDFLATNQIDESEVRWSPCGRIDGFDVVTILSLHSPKEPAMVTLDSEDASGSRGFVLPQKRGRRDWGVWTAYGVRASSCPNRSRVPDSERKSTPIGKWAQDWSGNGR